MKNVPLGRPFSTRRSGSALAVVVVVFVMLTMIAVAVAAYFVWKQGSSEASHHLTAEVESSDFVHDVVESGEVESSESVEVRCEVKGRKSGGTTILDVIPEGTFVRGPHTNELGEEVEGDIIATLDSSSLEIEMQQEAIILNNKKSLRDQAFNLLISAISALKEYAGQQEFTERYLTELTEKLGDDANEVLAAIQAVGVGETAKGTFHVDEQAFQAELFLAEENFRKAEQFYRYSESLAAQGYVTELQLKSDEFAVEKARKDRDAAQTKLDVLRIHTKKKTEKALAGDIFNALSVYRAEKNSVKVQEERVTEIEAQMAKCTIRAPQDGQVVYANIRDRRGDSDFVVEAGATVRERQTIVRLPNSNKMQVEAKISESKISLVKEGMKVTVAIDAFEDMYLDGVVTRVNQYPEPGSWFSSSVKQYETEIQILNPPEELKSGLTAKVRIHAQHIPSAQQVPIQAVYRHQGEFYCFVKEGPAFTARPVSLGASNEKTVVVTDGLTNGELVAMDPTSMLDEVELPEAIPVEDLAGATLAGEKLSDAMAAKYTAQPATESETSGQAEAASASDAAADREVKRNQRRNGSGGNSGATE